MQSKTCNIRARKLVTHDTYFMQNWMFCQQEQGACRLSPTASSKCTEWGEFTWQYRANIM